MSSTARIPVCVTLPPDLIERADRIAEAGDRSRSYVVTRALRAYCDQIEIPSPPGCGVASDAGCSTDTAGRPLSPSSAAAGTLPGSPSVLPQTAGTSGTAPASVSQTPAAGALSYPSAIHLDAMHRQAAAHRAQDNAHAEARDRAMRAATENLKGLEL